ncbi:Protein NIF3 [Tolypocladium ophioglossoides CBS 100239]|uniref:Protein NIF3 n=1 Tax=Tolypocladium ophioglossoides (strain CBS 100239) TaxID=1163406 RepID=A0A0L0NGR8_TOLOC|nr:Protein NIF3 [Tolypocladium ophioglossoides CBS 100239]
MSDAAAWGAWQVRPSAFTQRVVDAMKKLYVRGSTVGWLVADGAVKVPRGACGPLVGQRRPAGWQRGGAGAEAPGPGHQRPDVPGRRRRHRAGRQRHRQLPHVPVLPCQSGKTLLTCAPDPFIFSDLKSITTKDPQQATLLRLAQAGIAVYCPHTAVDAAPRGLNAWLADIIAGPHRAARSVAVPCAAAPDAHAPAGYGALGRFDAAVPLPEILKRLAARLGGLGHVMVASPVGADVATTTVRSFGVCAGSGYDVLRGADVDLLVTGEAGHHSALRAIQQGRTLGQVFHSNSERAYLDGVLRPRLEEQLRAAVPGAEVVLSEHDKDPFRIVDVGELP